MNIRKKIGFKKPICIILTIFLSSYALIFIGCKNDTNHSLISFKEQADKSYDMAKQRTIDAAVAAYVAEKGQHPNSLQDLVDYGLLAPQDIVDHEGKPLSLTPDMTTVWRKNCGTCGKKVPNTSKVGDICPHCGVRWGVEIKSNSK